MAESNEDNPRRGAAGPSSQIRSRKSVRPAIQGSITRPEGRPASSGSRPTPGFVGGGGGGSVGGPDAAAAAAAAPPGGNGPAEVVADAAAAVYCGSGLTSAATPPPAGDTAPPTPTGSAMNGAG